MKAMLTDLPRARAFWVQACAFLLLLCGLWLASGAALAQQGQKLTDADEQAMRSHVLRAETVDRALAVAQDARRQKVQGGTGKGGQTIDDWAHALAANPQAKALFDQHQISARDYIVTMIAIMRADFAAQTQPKTPDEAGSNAANVAYVTAHQARINAALKGDNGASAKDPSAK